MNHAPPKRILLINPNTTREVTARLQAHLQALLPRGTELIARTAAFGAPYIACESSHAVAAHAVLASWAAEPTADAVLIGCFGDPGLFALREHATAPVTGLAEAAFIEAARSGPFAVVTGGPRWKPMLQRLAQSLGFGSLLLHTETVAPSGAQLLADPASGARSIIIGGAGLAGWAARLQADSTLPLIDSVEAGLRVLLGGHAPAPVPAAEPRPDLVPWLPLLGHADSTDRHETSHPFTASRP
jgi:Asp/Glu/hydantoin racemase